VWEDLAASLAKHFSFRKKVNVSIVTLVLITKSLSSFEVQVLEIVSLLLVVHLVDRISQVIAAEPKQYKTN